MSDQLLAAWRPPAWLSRWPCRAERGGRCLLGLVVGLPLAWAAARSRAVRLPALGFASLVQTVPSLALLALFYPVLLALSAVAKTLFGHGFSALGFLPSLIALSLYALLPILRNGVAGLTGLDPAVVEAADAVGMTPRQRLLQVEAPLAAPIVMAGGAHGGGLGDRGGDPVHRRRLDQPWRLHFLRAADRELGAGAVRLRRLRRPGAHRRRPAGPDRERAGAAIARAAGDRRCGPAGRCGPGARPSRRRRGRPQALCDRREELLRTVHPGRPDERPAAGRRHGGDAALRPRLGHRLSRAAGGGA